MQLTSRLWCFLILFAVGAGLYMGIGDYLANDYIRIIPKTTFLTWVLIRVHLFGFFMGTVGLIGMLAGVKDFL